MLKNLLWNVILLFSFTANALEVQLSSSQIYEGDSLELQIIDDKPIDTVNFTPLTMDFMLGSQQRGQSSQFINGVGHTTYSVGIVLFPVKTGSLTIPALNVGTQQTSPQTLIVKKKSDRPTNDASSTKAISFNASVNNTTPYVGQTIFYTLQLKNTDFLLGGEIIPPTVENGRLSQIGQDTEKTIIEKDQPIKIVERTYALVPNTEGDIQLKPALFNGSVLFQHQPKSTEKKFLGLASASDLFGDFFNTSRPIQISSNALSMKVQPKPLDWEGWWLPSSQVNLTSDYKIPDNPQIDDTITMTITLDAIDVDANDLPIPKIPQNHEWRVYPEPETRSTMITKENNLKGQISVKYTLVPLSSGQKVIPQIQIPWFDTIHKNRKIATISEKKIQILEDSTSPTKSENKEIQQSNSPQPIPKIPVAQNQPNFWLGLIIGMGLIIFMGIIGIIIYRYQRKRKSKEKKKPIPDFYPF